MDEKELIKLNAAISEMIRVVEGDEIEQPSEDINDIFRERMNIYPVTQSMTVKKIKIRIVEE